MGFFSFITSDTNKSIANAYSKRKTFKVHLITRDRQIFPESNYNGYGNFNCKDIYVLIGDLNGITGDQEEIRDKVFDDLLNGGITNGKVIYKYGKDFPHWEFPIESEKGLNANQLLKNGFTKIFPNWEFQEFANAGINVPKIVQKLPKNHSKMTNEEWQNYFDNLPHAKSCPNQGYF
tara:strand:- start:140 stop:670 length:531 start_codon:yes stop_codon:yes gene_type:complete